MGDLWKADGVKNKAVDVFTDNGRTKVLLRTVKTNVFESDVSGVFPIEAPDGQNSGIDTGLSS